MIYSKSIIYKSIIVILLELGVTELVSVTHAFINLNIEPSISEAFAEVSTIRASQEWEKFKIQHGRSYKSSKEEASRRQTFQSNLEKLDRMNNDHEKINGNRPFGVNEFSDLDPSEFAKTRLTHIPGVETRSNIAPEFKHEPALQSLPTQIDWSLVGATTPEKIKATAVLAGPFQQLSSLKQQPI